MRRIQDRLVMIMTLLFVAVAVSQTGSPAALVAGIAAAALAAAVAARYGGVVVGSREVTVGARAHAHREALSVMPAPQHPATAGRPRTRAPSMAAFAA